MEISRRLFSCCVLSALAIGVGLGWTFARREVIHSEKIVTMEKASSSSSRAAAYVGTSTKQIEKRTNWKTVTRWLKDGTIEQERERQSDTRGRDSKAVTSTGESRDESHTEKAMERMTTTTITTGRDRWMLGAAVVADRGLLAEKLPTIAIRVDRRILGPLWAGLQLRFPFEVSAGIAASF